MEVYVNRITSANAWMEHTVDIVSMVRYAIVLFYDLLIKNFVVVLLLYVHDKQLWSCRMITYVI